MIISLTFISLVIFHMIYLLQLQWDQTISKYIFL